MGEVDTNTSTVEAIAILCLSRDVFDMEEIKQFRQQLDEKGIDHHQITGPLIDRLRERMFVSADAVMNAMLDIRNQLKPPRKETDVSDAEVGPDLDEP